MKRNSLYEYGYETGQKFVGINKQVTDAGFNPDYCHVFNKGFGTCDFTEPTKDKFLTFTANETNSMVQLNGQVENTEFTVSFEYSIDGGKSWNEYSFTLDDGNFLGEEIELTNVGDSVKFRGVNPDLGAVLDDEGEIVSRQYAYFQMSGSISASGDVTSLINGIGGDAVLKPFCYESMFQACESLTTAPNLPSTTLAEYCYSGMFQDCESLTTAPNLPSTTLAEYCYYGMFQACESLTTAPNLPSTTLAEYCYSGMFYGCTSLTTAPALPSTTLAEYCYYGMFQGCTGLTTAPELPATTLAEHCYESMFQDCTSLTTAPSVLPATTLPAVCYGYMFSGCELLTTAPELPAETLAVGCYSCMFNGCTSLDYIKALFLTNPDNKGYIYTYDWVNGVSQIGTFVKNANATWSVTGESGIPDGWTVETDEP